MTVATGEAYQDEYHIVDLWIQPAKEQVVSARHNTLWQNSLFVKEAIVPDMTIESGVKVATL